MKGWVILDRDGVINRDSPDYIRSLAEWQPLPGSIEAIARRFAVDLRGQPAIGDSLRDLLAAHRAGCRPLLVRTGNGRRTEAQLARASHPELAAVPVYADLAEAAADLIGGRP